VLDDLTATHTYNKHNVIVCWCGHYTAFLVWLSSICG